MRCKVHEVSVVCARAEYGRRMGEGAVVDFDEVITPAQDERPAYTLGDALAGREECFEAVGAAPSPAGLPQADVEDDANDEEQE